MKLSQIQAKYALLTINSGEGLILTKEFYI